MNQYSEIFKLVVTLFDEDDEQLDNTVRQLRQELVDLTSGSVEYYSSNVIIPSGVKAIDPATLNALILSVSPIAITKLLEFLHNWMLRKEERVIKIKVQRQDGQSIEIEVPASTTQQELKTWIKTVETAISKNQGKK